MREEDDGRKKREEKINRTSERNHCVLAMCIAMVISIESSCTMVRANAP